MSWEKHEKKAASGFRGLLVVGCIGIASISAVGFVFGIFGETAQVAKEEFGAKASLKKYEWFKDASASISKQKTNVMEYQQRIKSFESDYEGVKKSEWPRDERQEYNQLKSELVGIKQIYNDTVAEYNAQSSKFNWSMYDQTNGDVVPKSFEIL